MTAYDTPDAYIRLGRAQALEEVQPAIDGFLAEISAALAENTRLGIELSQAHVEIKRLRAALAEYGAHTRLCQERQAHGHECSCGLMRLIKGS